MSLGGGASAPKPVNKAPERVIDVKPEDIQIGDDAMDTGNLKKGGKRSLLKPAGGSNLTGLNI